MHLCRQFTAQDPAPQKSKILLRENDALRISGFLTSLERAFIQGIRDASGTFDQAVCTDSSDQLRPCSSSSARFKEDIVAMGEVSAGLHALRPVRFRYTKNFAGEDEARPVQYGLIAEEVAELYPDLVTYDDEGRPATVRYQALTPLLLNEMQKQLGELQATRARIDEQDRELSHLRSLEADVAALSSSLLSKTEQRLATCVARDGGDFTESRNQDAQTFTLCRQRKPVVQAHKREGCQVGRPPGNPKMSRTILPPGSRTNASTPWRSEAKKWVAPLSARHLCRHGTSIGTAPLVWLVTVFRNRGSCQNDSKRSRS